MGKFYIRWLFTGFLDFPIFRKSGKSEHPKIRIFGFSGISEVRFPKIRISGNPKIRIFRFPDFRISENPDFRNSENPDFPISGASDARHLKSECFNGRVVQHLLYFPWCLSESPLGTCKLGSRVNAQRKSTIPVA